MGPYSSVYDTQVTKVFTFLKVTIMGKKVCKLCSRHCVLYYYALSEPPMESPVSVEGETPDGQEMADIRGYCETHFIKDPTV